RYSPFTAPDFRTPGAPGDRAARTRGPREHRGGTDTGDPERTRPTTRRSKTKRRSAKTKKASVIVFSLIRVLQIVFGFLLIRRGSGTLRLLLRRNTRTVRLLARGRRGLGLAGHLAGLVIVQGSLPGHVLRLLRHLGELAQVVRRGRVRHRDAGLRELQHEV